MTVIPMLEEKGGGKTAETGEDDAVPGRVKTLVPKWRTVFTAIVMGGAVIIILSLPKTSSEARAGVVIAVTALLWCTEGMPLMITALVPAILFPFAGTLTAKQVGAKYFNDISMLLFGTFLMAESVESCGLHRRIALGILSLLGRSEALLMLGAMAVTWKLSMFMSNTATTAMMLPIIKAIIESLRRIQQNMDRKKDLEMKQVETNGNVAEPLDDGEEGAEDDSKDSPQFTWFCKGLILSIPYGASIGGIATLTGTPPNLVFTGYYETAFPDAPVLDYGSWMRFAYPISLLAALVGWHVLVIMYARNSYLDLISGIVRFFKKLFKPDSPVELESDESKKWKHVNQTIKKKYRALGRLRFPEIILFILLGILVLLWLLRDPAGFDGWAQVHTDNTWNKDGGTTRAVYLSDSWVVIMMGILLFNIPQENPLIGTWLMKPPPGKKFARSDKLLNMDIVMTKTPWDVLMLLGGGYAIAAGCEVSGLSQWLGDSFSFLDGQSEVVVALVISILVACLTEVASNTASTTLLMPILAAMSVSLKLNPLYLMITGTIAASLAFCLPSATGPNALVFSFKEIRVIDMLRTGLFMNVCSILIVVMGVSTWTRSIMNITDEFPDWANVTLNN